MAQIFEIANDASEIQLSPEAEQRIEVIRKYANTNLSSRDFVLTFGVPDEHHPWGTEFWRGMDIVLASYRRLQRGWYLELPCRRCWFNLPSTFSTLHARSPMSLVNPCSEPVQTFPAFCFGPIPGEQQYFVGCYNIVVHASRPWRVHQSWLTLFPRLELEIVDV